MDYVYICKDGENEELRYSIRSVVKNMPEGRVWVVGGKPSWYVGNHIPVPQNGPKYENALDNLMAVCRSREISKDFVLMNDDFFVIKKLDEIPVFSGGFFVEKIALYNMLAPRSSYTKKIAKTMGRLQRLGIAMPVDFDIHVPMTLNKVKLLSILKAYPDNLWRSMYGNIFKVRGTHITDVKYYAKDAMAAKSYNYKSNIYPYVSSDDESFNVLYRDLLKKMFNTASKYEKPRTTSRAPGQTRTDTE